MSQRSAQKGKSGEVRIIAGQWRGSKLPVLDRPGLRPTSDRVRETVFNWLQHEVAGRRVLDAFAGTGALGFEAASRGAAEVVLLERDAAAAMSLRASADRLGAATVHVHHDDALAWLRRSPAQRFDLVFLDPPFAGDLWAEAVQAVLPCLAESAWVYLECPLSTVLTLPTNWQVHRQGQTRDVRSQLLRAMASPAP